MWSRSRDPKSLGRASDSVDSTDEAASLPVSKENEIDFRAAETLANHAISFVPMRRRGPQGPSVFRSPFDEKRDLSQALRDSAAFVPLACLGMNEDRSGRTERVFAAVRLVGEQEPVFRPDLEELETGATWAGAHGQFLVYGMAIPGGSSRAARFLSDVIRESDNLVANHLCSSTRIAVEPKVLGAPESLYRKMDAEFPDGM